MGISGNINISKDSRLSSSRYCDNRPLITVGITCYNAQDSIQRAVESALNQDWSAFEVIVVDDGSSDFSVDILSKMALSEDKLTVIVHDKNQGCAHARNTLVNEAKGEFIAFFDDDDVSQPDRLSLQVNKILSVEKQVKSAIIACYCSGKRIYPNGYVMPFSAIGSSMLMPHGEDVANYLLFNQRKKDLVYGAGTPTCSLMTRTKNIKDMGGFDVSLRRQEDIDLALRFAFKNGYFIGIENPVLTQYATSGSEKSAYSEFQSTLTLLEKYKSYLQKSDSFEYMKLWTELRYKHFSGKDSLALIVLLKLLMLYPLRTSRHFLSSAFKRFFHELRMKA